MRDFAAERERMVERQLVARGVRDPGVLAAMRTVPREAFVAPELQEFAYQDGPLPIESGQTISQPYIVALMTEALELQPGDRVLEIGTGSGYAAAILGKVAREVWTIERHGDLAEIAARRLGELGLDDVHVVHGDGTLGLAERAPFDAIVVAAGGPRIPPSLVDQLAVGGRLVIPVGAEKDLQSLRRLTRGADGELVEEDLGGVRFVPLVGVEGWEGAPAAAPAPPSRAAPRTIASLLREVAEPVSSIESAELASLLERAKHARIVLVGEATHGTSEFYRLRARITRELVRAYGFTIVSAEADWPDAMRVNRYVQGLGESGRAWRAFARFPTWMWRNHEVMEFVEWLREWNAARPDGSARAGFYGLDLYSLYTSIRLVLEYLDRVDPESARIARQRYGCLTPWEGDAATYGRAAVSGRYRICEKEAVASLRALVEKELEYVERDGIHYFDAVQNARLVADAEQYYRVMYYGGVESWNLRDRHMFDTLEALLRFHGPESKAVVWAHNSHLGDASATQMGARGEWNLGQLCRERFGADALLVGFGTHHGTVAAAHEWDGPVATMTVRPSHPESYERLCHDAEVAAFVLHLREPAREEVRLELEPARLERAIGVLYRPDTELQSHYFHAVLPRQFDAWIWIDETHAVHPLGDADMRGLPRAHPFSSYGPA